MTPTHVPATNQRSAYLAAIYGPQEGTGGPGAGDQMWVDDGPYTMTDEQWQSLISDARSRTPTEPAHIADDLDDPHHPATHTDPFTFAVLEGL